MAHDSPRHDDVEMSAELSEDEQHRAIARLAAAYKQANRPPLTEAERREREGDITLPFTPEMREDYKYLSTVNVIIAYVIVFLVLWMVIIGIWALLDNLLNREVYGQLLDKAINVAIIGPLLLAIPLYFPFARWWRARRAAAVNKIQSYHRYAGRCEITETQIYNSKGADTYRYRVRMASPPALVPHITFAYRNSAERHKELCDVTWGTIEYVLMKRVSLLTIRDESDQVAYSYEETL